MNLQKILCNDVVVLWSGGIDSTGLIFILLKKYSCNIYPIFVKHGQRNQEFELRSIEYYSDLFLKEYKPRFNRVFIATSDIPAVEFKNINTKNRHFLRNSDLINNAVRFAIHKEIKTILIATFEDDFLDGSTEYLIAKSKEVEKGTEIQFNIFSPFLHLDFVCHSKTELINSCRGEVKLSMTRSCYEDSGEPCGVCSSCIRREKALANSSDNIFGY